MTKPEIHNPKNLDRRHVCNCYLCEQPVIYPVCADCTWSLEEYERTWLRKRRRQEQRKKIRGRLQHPFRFFITLHKWMIGPNHHRE